MCPTDFNGTEDWQTAAQPGLVDLISKATCLQSEGKMTVNMASWSSLPKQRVAWTDGDKPTVNSFISPGGTQPTPSVDSCWPYTFNTNLRPPSGWQWNPSETRGVPKVPCALRKELYWYPSPQKKNILLHTFVPQCEKDGKFLLHLISPQQMKCATIHIDIRHSIVWWVIFVPQGAIGRDP